MEEKAKKDKKSKGNKFFKVVLAVLGVFALVVVVGLITGAVRFGDTDGDYCNNHVLENYSTDGGIAEEVFVKRFNECLESRGVPEENWLRPSSFTPPSN